MANELEEVNERALVLLKEAYLETLSSPRNFATMANCAPKLSLDPENEEHREEFERLAQYLAGKQYLEKAFPGSFMVFTVTPLGHALVEGELQQQTQATSHTYNISGDAYSSVFGSQQNVEMNVSFDMRTAETELQQTREEVERRGGPDVEELRELLDELERLLRGEEALEKGRFAKFLGVLQRNGWIAGPTASLLMNYATRAVEGAS